MRRVIRKQGASFQVRSPGATFRSPAPRILLGTLFFLGATVPAFPAEPTSVASGKGRPQSLILISVEGLRPDYLSSYGGKKGQPTPAIDRIDTGGWIVEQALTPSASTLPALATLMTGRSPFRHRVWDDGYRNRLPGSETTLAEWLKQRGYQTAAFLGSSRAAAERGFDQGFGTYQDGFVLNPSGTWNLTARTAGTVTSGALSWLDGVGDSPFFLWVHLVDPSIPGRGTATQPAAEPEKAYFGRISSVDAAVGSLLERAKSLKSAADLLVVLTADHGVGLGEHGEYQAGFSLYETTLRVPLLIGRPFGQGGEAKRITAPAGLQDVLPTLAAVMGLPAPAGVEGRNLLVSSGVAYYASALEGREAFGWNAREAVASGPWRLLLGPGEELYDIANDPGQLKNLAASRPEQIARLKQELAKIASGSTLPPAHFLAGPEPPPAVSAGLKGMGLAPLTMKQARTRKLARPAAAADKLPLLEEMYLRTEMLGYQALSGVRDTFLQADPENLLGLLGIASLDSRGDEAARKRGKEMLLQAQRLYPLESEVYHQLAHLAFPENRFADAAALLKAALALNPRHPGEVTYDLACAYARKGDKDLAFTKLKESVKLGYRDVTHLTSDPDLEPILAQPAVKKWLDAEFRLPTGS